MDKEHKDLDTIDLEAARLAQYMHKAWKKHQNTVYWVDINLALETWLKFYQTRSNAIILHETLPAYCLPKVVRMETGEVMYEKVYMSPRPPPKISLKHEWKRELGSEIARRPEGEVPDKQKVPNQPNQIQTQIMTERRDPLFVLKKERPKARFSRDSTNFNVEETNHDWTVRRVVCRDANHERSMLNEFDIDFRIPGLPHSVVNQAENSRVRELVKKIENHPHRQSLQRDLQQSNAYNPFSVNSKKMMKDMGNVELFELCETISKVQCSERLLFWSQGIVYCTCGHLLKESEANRGAIQCTTSWPSVWENYKFEKEMHQEAF